MAIIEKPLNVFEIANQLGYYEYAPHPDTGKTVRKVDVGRLCTHPNINMWAKYRPMIYPSVIALTEAQVIECWGGLSLTKNSSLPTGGENSPFRVSDFWKYDHNAIPPVYVEIISVNGQTEPPFNLMKGSQATIIFKLIPGQVNPQWINSQTIREKRVGGDAGYGGLSWVSEGTNPMLEPISRVPSQVFGTEILEVIFEQTIDVQVVPRMEFMYWLGSAQNRYDNRLNMEVYDPNYEGMFSISSIGEDLVFTALPLFWDPIESRVQARTRTVNSYGVVGATRLSVRYTINLDMPIPGEDHDRFAQSETFTLQEGETTQIVDLEFISRNATYSYKIYYYLERLIGSTWDTLAETMLIQNLYIPPEV